MNRKMMLSLLAAGALSGLDMVAGPGKEDPLKGVDIDAEWELIKIKKSKLSFNQRRLVRQKKELKGQS